MGRLRIKVCGTKCFHQVLELQKLPVDFVGHIFYPKSPRFLDGAGCTFLPKMLSIKRVGVFVNPTFKEIRSVFDFHGLSVVQLHGNESPSFCEEIRDLFSCTVIKAFSVTDALCRDLMKRYTGKVDYFLFDTKTPYYGGSGLRFDWEILREYDLKVPFFISGGIGMGDAERIRDLSNPLLFGVDINSKFEITPGYKCMDRIRKFVADLTAE